MSRIANQDLVIAGVFNSIAPVLTSGQVSALQTDVNGNLFVSIAGTIINTPAVPVVSQLTRADFSISTATDTDVVAGVGGRTIRVFRILLTVGTAADTITFKDTTPTVFTALDFQAGGGLCMDFLSDPYYVTASGKGFRITTSSTAAVKGSIWYTQS